MLKNFKAVLAAGVAVAALAAMPARADTAVGLELSLLIDTSGSVDSTEFALQRDGYVNAFNSVAVQNAIAGISGGIAVNVIQWSGAAQQAQVVGWTHITDATSSSAFATQISNFAFTSAFGGQTAPGSAINYAVPLFNNDFTGARLVIDVSGDGAQNNGDDTATARDAAVAAGIRINGLPIGDATLAAWYQANIQGGTNSFTLPVSTFAGFNTAIQQKLIAEITDTPVPEPATMAVLGIGLLGLGFARRRR